MRVLLRRLRRIRPLPSVRSGIRETSLAYRLSVRHTSRESLMGLSQKPLVAGCVVAGCCALGVAISACGGDSSSPPGSSTAGVTPTTIPSCADAGLSIAFNPVYSAYIDKSVHTFEVPAVVYGTDNEVTWYADSNMVGMEKDEERNNEVLLTMR